jgi:uncharacterized protein VirK/YbjX
MDLSNSPAQVDGTIIVLNILAIYFREELKENGFYRAVVRTLAALRIFLFPSRVRQIVSFNLPEKFRHPNRTIDPLYFLSHKFYLSNRFSLAQRLQCVVAHHAYEARSYSQKYKDDIYRSAGILLWQNVVEGHKFTITLVGSDDVRHEGELSVILCVDSIILTRMSFSYIDADVFGLDPQISILITRNQSVNTSMRSLFFKSFNQNFPPYFCTAAIFGIAFLSGFKIIFGIKHDAQISHCDKFDLGFRNSYSNFWEKFDGVEVNQQAYKLNVPFRLSPLDKVKQGHRLRARNRRGYWNDIMLSSISALRDYRLEQATRRINNLDGLNRAGRSGSRELTNQSTEPFVSTTMDGQGSRPLRSK